MSSRSTMTLLFEKVASITDCRSTGHFVLPKRKVEVYPSFVLILFYFILLPFDNLDFYRGLNTYLYAIYASPFSDALQGISFFGLLSFGLLRFFVVLLFCLLSLTTAVTKMSFQNLFNYYCVYIARLHFSLHGDHIRACFACALRF
jgi:hypothetical protein